MYDIAARPCHEENIHRPSLENLTGHKNLVPDGAGMVAKTVNGRETASPKIINIKINQMAELNSKAYDDFQRHTQVRRYA